MSDHPPSRPLRLLLAQVLLFCLVAGEIGDAGAAEVRSDPSAEYTAGRATPARLLASCTTPSPGDSPPLPGSDAAHLPVPALRWTPAPRAGTLPVPVSHPRTPALPRAPPGRLQPAPPPLRDGRPPAMAPLRGGEAGSS